MNRRAFVISTGLLCAGCVGGSGDDAGGASSPTTVSDGRDGLSDGENGGADATGPGEGDQGDEPADGDDPAVSGPAPDGGSSSGGDRDGTPPAEAFARTLSVAAVGDLPASLSLAVSLVPHGETITREQVGRLTLKIENTGDAPLDVGRPYYKGASADDGDPGILLVDADAPEAQGRTRSCLGDGHTETALAWTEEYPVPDTVAPGETVSHEFVVVDDPADPGCVPPGRYRFENTFAVDGGPDGGTDWWFELAVTDQGSE